MIYDVVFRGGKMVTPSGLMDGDIAVSKGKIVAVGVVRESGKVEKDCSGKFILPGLIDIHVHFRDPGFPEKGDFASESAAAAAGGVTTVFDMPNTNPPTLTLETLEQKRALAKQKSLVNYGFFLGLSSDNLSEIERAQNIAGVKVYMGSSTGNLLVQDMNIIEKLFETGRLVIVHAEDESIIREHERKFQSSNDPRIHSLIRDHQSAFEATRAILHTAKKYEARLHLTHITTEEEIDEIKKFKTSGKVSCDVTPHHLALTEAYYGKRGNFVKVNPPLRREEDRQALWKGIKNGVVDLIASDHAPHTKEEKEESYWQAPAGIPGIQTMLPLLLDSVEHGDFVLSDIPRLTAENPARLFGVSKKGKIEVGFDADLVVVDMSMERELTEIMLLSRCRWSPFLGWKFHGWPVMTMVNGTVVFEEGKIVSDSKGKEVQFV